MLQTLDLVIGLKWGGVGYLERVPGDPRGGLMDPRPIGTLDFNGHLSQCWLQNGHLSLIVILGVLIYN